MTSDTSLTHLHVVWLSVLCAYLESIILLFLIGRQIKSMYTYTRTTEQTLNILGLSIWNTRIRNFGNNERVKRLSVCECSQCKHIPFTHKHCTLYIVHQSNVYVYSVDEVKWSVKANWIWQSIEKSMYISETWPILEAIDEFIIISFYFCPSLQHFFKLIRHKAFTV